MSRGGWHYIEDVSPSSVNHVWKVVVVMAASTAGMMVTAGLLPPDRPRDWAWIAPGAGVIAAVAGVLAALGRRTQATDGHYAPPAPLAFTLAMVAVVGFALMSAGLSGPYGIFRQLVFVPAVIVSAFGSRPMVATITATAVAAVVGTSLAQGLALSAVPAMTAAYAFGWGGIIVIIRMVEREAVKGMQRHRLVVRMAAVVATANDLDDGLREMLPLIGTLLDATAVDVRSLDPAAPDDGPGRSTDAPDGTVISRWTAAGDAPRHEPTRDELHAVAGTQRVAVHDDHTLLPIASAQRHHPLVAVVTAVAPDVRNRLTFEYDADQSRVHLDLLANRMHLIGQLEELSRTDDLTGLGNRRALLERLELALAATRRSHDPLTVVMIDVDHFKDYNDVFGHLAGDRALVDIASMLRERLRVTDLASRYGGEEFCLVLPGTAPAEAAEIVAELHSTCRTLSAHRPLTFSAGIAGWVAGETADQLVGRADEALYAAKVNGRDRSWLAPAPGTGTRSTSTPSG